MGMNLMNIMKQVQNAQKRAELAQKELADLVITGESAGGLVQVTCDGQGKFKSIKISPEAKSESIEMLEDLITAAINQATEKASVEMQAKMKQITGGISIPGLNF
ncbi:YbaB/EbfC family nucleoid-associated protein [bacterium]|nr:YbaB/EbfC family nucleoid-associated protein [bacterium]